MTDYERGKWETLNLLSSAEYGKQCYFLQENDLIYSRETGNYLTLEDAITEFANRLEWEG